MKHYWFYLEPYVYTSFVDEFVLLYNTLDGHYIESRNPGIRDIILQCKEIPESVVLLSESEINSPETNLFISRLRNYFMGDIIDSAYSTGNPIQLMPILNIQTEINRIKTIDERSIGENILLYLNEFVFYANSPSAFPNRNYPSNIPLNWEKGGNDFTCIHTLLKQLPRSIIENFTITIVTKNLEMLVGEKELMRVLSASEAKKRFDLYYRDNIPVLLNHILKDDKLSITLNIDFPVDEKTFCDIFLLFAEDKIGKVEYAFFISSINDMDEANRLIEKYKISSYVLRPCYTGYNDDFFRNNIFLEKDDLLSEPVSMRNIFLHQSLNISFFGKLHVSAAGDVFSGIFSPKLGSANQQTLPELLSKEFCTTQAWFRLRNDEPCNKCLYQWLCPAPGNYELLLKKKDLCQIGNLNIQS